MIIDYCLNKKYIFQIPLLNMDKTGHDHDDYNESNFYFAANKPIESIREAYLKSEKKYPKICPHHIFYDNAFITRNVYHLLKKMNCPILNYIDYTEFDESADEDEFELNFEYHFINNRPYEMYCAYIIWFICLSDKDLKISEVENPPMLQFYDKENSIDGLGYEID